MCLLTLVKNIRIRQHYNLMRKVSVQLNYQNENENFILQ